MKSHGSKPDLLAFDKLIYQTLFHLKPRKLSSHTIKPLTNLTCITYYPDLLTLSSLTLPGRGKAYPHHTNIILLFLIHPTYHRVSTPHPPSRLHHSPPISPPPLTPHLASTLHPPSHITPYLTVTSPRHQPHPSTQNLTQYLTLPLIPHPSTLLLTPTTHPTPHPTPHLHPGSYKNKVLLIYLSNVIITCGELINDLYKVEFGLMEDLIGLVSDLIGSFILSDPH